MGNKVKEKRLELKLSQEELSKRADISRNTIAKIESGQDLNLTKFTMQAIANALGTSVTEIFFF